MDLSAWYNNLLKRINSNSASELELARILGISIEELDADTTKCDEREE